MIRKVTNQANKFGIEVDPKFGQPMTREERILKERQIGEANKAKKVASAKLLLEQTIKRVEAKAEKKAAKGMIYVSFRRFVLILRRRLSDLLF